MRRILHFSLCLIALAVSAMNVAQAAPELKVAVRGGVHDGYTRIVLAWPTAPGYTASQSETSLTLTFKKAASFSVTGAKPDTLPRVGAFATTDTSVTVSFDKEQTVRHFVIGSRLIIDLKGKATPPAPEKSPEVKVDPPKTAEVKPEEKPVVKPTEPLPPEIKPEAAPVAEKPVAEVPAPVTVPTPPPSSQLDAHMVNVTATQAIGLAAFQRFGTLWIVLDQPDYALTPQIAGPQKDKFEAFQRVPLTGATAFKLKLPPGMHVYGEGGGLIWKITITPTPRKAESLAFTRSFDQAKKPGGSLLWPTSDSRQVIAVPDADTGESVTVVTTSSSRDFSGSEQNFVELTTLDTIVGLALRSKVDDLAITRDGKGVTISRPDGLSLSPETDIASLKIQMQQKTDKVVPEPVKPLTESVTDPKAPPAPAGPFTRMFAFDRWLMGGPTMMHENQRIIMSGMAPKTDQGKAEDLLTLAKMELANGRGPEALGYIEFAGDLIKDLQANPEFMALRGAAAALTGQYDRAFKDFSNKTFDEITEIKYWRSFALANLEDWKQAEDVMPKDVSILNQYPQGVKIPVALTLAEVSLRAGDTSTADKILEIIAQDEEHLSIAQKAGLEYLRGESRRQQKDFDGMKTMWEPLSKGDDHLYRAKAGLALTSQLLEKKEMPAEAAIDQLEGLRYAWRGDELETAINYKLGRIYMESGQPIKGLTLLRQAASLAPGSALGKQITTYMTDKFKDLFLNGTTKDLNPIDALTIYDEFSELIPSGEEGDKVARQLAERLVDADLLPRAENLLQSQIDTRLSGMQGAEVAMRLASIQVLDGKPDKALLTLNRAAEFLIPLPMEQGADKRREIALLRARALSDQKKPEEAFAALALLQQAPDVLRLRADIAWRAKRWQDAGDSLEQLVNGSTIDMTKPLGDEDAKNILNWAVALYLADNRYVLANLREKYADAMAQTQLAKKFDVVTRPRQNSLLADRNTINTIIGETDIFKGFLDSFAASKPLPAAPAPGAATPAVPTPIKPVAGE